jgi:hypothetical protein
MDSTQQPEFRLENLSQRIEEQVLWREGDRTGHIRFEWRTPRPNGVKLTLQFDQPTQLSDDQSKKVEDFLDYALRRIEAVVRSD